MTITNRYLKKSIEEMSNFLKYHTQPPEDLVFNFIMELRVSNLLIPATIEDSTISFPHLIGEKGQTMLPLFTDNDEFSKYATDLNPIPNEFGYYQYVMNNLKFDGIIVNCEGDEFFIDRELTSSVPPLDEMEGEGIDPQRLKQLALNAKNEELLDFIRDDAHFNRPEGLLEILNRSAPLNVVFSDEDLSQYSQNGIIKRTDTGGFVVSQERVGTETYTALFTSAEAARNAKRNEDYHYLIQVSNMHEIVKFTLTNDMDGIVINPGLEEYYIRRHNLISMLDDEDLMNPDLADAIDYAFEF